jgi:hypothetical protein
MRILGIDFRERMELALMDNEIGGDLAYAYRFTDPDGKSGRSGYSFGRSQFDCSHYGRRRISEMLTKMGFSQDQIWRLVDNDPRIDDCQRRMELPEVRRAVDAFDSEHLDQMIEHCSRLRQLPRMEDDAAFAMLVDTHNQFTITPDGLTHTWLMFRDFEDELLTAEMVMDFKIDEYKWGRSEHGRKDIRRRYDNVRKHFPRQRA